MIKALVLFLFLIGAFFEFFEVRPRSKPIIRFRKGDISAYISGTLFCLVGLIIYFWD